MTRIIAGYAGSISLAVPKSGTRPTSDRVREAIFSALESADALAGARVVDLYAGSGALGLEAASRGAAEVVLVERDAAAAKVCRANAATIRSLAPRGVEPRIDVVAQPVAAWLGGGAAARWDLAFVDPPYDLSEADLALVLEALAPQLLPDATVVLERSTRSPEPTLPAGLELVRTKSYGETAVHWLAPR